MPERFVVLRRERDADRVREHGPMLVVDAANVVGSRPDGWWRDRAGAARRLCAEIGDAVDAGRIAAPVVVVLEGAARRGVEAGERNGIRIVHADGAGDDAIVGVVGDLVAEAPAVTVVTADRALGDRVRQAGADVAGPRWLLDTLAGTA